ncbi:MAG: toxin-antitoxin system HicB family antitoxin [Anaerolineales bacterium]|nr:toxin-antitoxin system HicB family antitoxin [Anaerolineales bacterium]MCA9928216.1 toxin-antitoxin system HicB family antitoxin [Anaerolineales bacterium]
MGRFTLRLPETLHNELESRARQEGVSLNQYIVYTLTKQVATSYTIQVLPETAVKEQAARYQALLEKLPRSSEKELDAVLQAREQVEPEPDLDSETIQKIQNRIAKAQQTEL